tara:strand:+ start:5206 stop:6486 length:1281 start_codon:yes stop_codon:yes gene_type:complete
MIYSAPTTPTKKHPTSQKPPWSDSKIASNLNKRSSENCGRVSDICKEIRNGKPISQNVFNVDGTLVKCNKRKIIHGRSETEETKDKKKKTVDILNKSGYFNTVIFDLYTQAITYQKHLEGHDCFEVLSQMRNSSGDFKHFKNQLDIIIKFENFLIKSVNEIHQLGVIFKDLKPENIMYITEKKEFKHIDHDECNLADETYSAGIGTSMYMDPELQENINSNIFSNTQYKKYDRYSLGISLTVAYLSYLTMHIRLIETNDESALKLITNILKNLQNPSTSLNYKKNEFCKDLENVLDLKRDKFNSIIIDKIKILIDFFSHYETFDLEEFLKNTSTDERIELSSSGKRTINRIQDLAQNQSNKRQKYNDYTDGFKTDTESLSPTPENADLIILRSKPLELQDNSRNEDSSCTVIYSTESTAATEIIDV